MESAHPAKYCPLCGRELWGQKGDGTRTEISPEDKVKFGIVHPGTLSFCDKCDLMYVLFPGEVGLTEKLSKVHYEKEVLRRIEAALTAAENNQKKEGK
jgi:hypothetical protein